MREVSPLIWSMWLGDMPMPEGATHEMMDAAIEAIEEIEQREEDVKMIAWYQESREHYEKKVAFWKTKPNEPDWQKTMDLYTSILATIDDGIDFLRGRING